MGKRDRRIDDYIAKSAPFAKPILKHLRQIVHEGCPEVEETMKWSMPHFMYHGMLCGMAAFKEHCSFGFWKGSLIVGDGAAATRDAMGQFGRITSITDLPPKKALIGYIHEAMRLNEVGVKSPARAGRKPRPALPMPPDLTAALRRNRKADAAFRELSPSHRREYIEWITEAKGDATRKRRLDTTLEWVAEGKSRNWKYERTK